MHIIREIFICMIIISFTLNFFFFFTKSLFCLLKFKKIIVKPYFSLNFISLLFCHFLTSFFINFAIHSAVINLTWNVYGLNAQYRISNVFMTEQIKFEFQKPLIQIFCMQEFWTISLLKFFNYILSQQKKFIRYW